MNDKITITSELAALEADLRQCAAEIGPQLRKAVEITARNVRDDWREFSGNLRRAPAYSRSITYDIEGRNVFGKGIIRAEIGPEKSRPQGALGNLIEYGSVNNPPNLFGLNALNVNERDFVRGCTIAVETAEALAGINRSPGAAAAAILRGSAR